MRKVPCRASERGISGVRALGGWERTPLQCSDPQLTALCHNNPGEGPNGCVPSSPEVLGTGGVPGCSASRRESTAGPALAPMCAVRQGLRVPGK